VPSRDDINLASAGPVLAGAFRLTATQPIAPVTRHPTVGGNFVQSEMGRRTETLNIINGLNKGRELSH